MKTTKHIKCFEIFQDSIIIAFTSQCILALSWEIKKKTFIFGFNICFALSIFVHNDSLPPILGILYLNFFSFVHNLFILIESVGVQ